MRSTNNITNQEQQTKKYFPLAIAAGIGSMLGSGIIVGLAATITVWQTGLDLTNGQVGTISGTLTFAIAAGSLLGGRLAEVIGIFRFFNWINLLYAIGAGICVLSNDFLTLLIGITIAGIASGADLPTSLTVVSHDAPNEEVSARLVSITQVFWQAGIFISYICSFFVSSMVGTIGPKIVFSILTFFAILTWLWRSLSPKFRAFHEEAIARHERKDNESKESLSVLKIMFGKNKKRHISIFISILIFYVGWNLLANTWGQFQTFMLVKAEASQSLATGAGIVLNLIAFFVSILFASIAGGKYQNKAFIVGSLIMFLAMCGLAFGGTNLWVIIAATGIYNMGSPLAGEALYKVWTQESFPLEIRSSIQGIINGLSRICCALFAFITPALVLPDRIRTTMFGFAGIIMISFIAGLTTIRLQKKYKVNQSIE